MRYMMLIHHDEAALAAAPQKELWAEYAAFNEALAKAGGSARRAAAAELGRDHRAPATTARPTCSTAPMPTPRNSSPAISSSTAADLDEAIAWAKRCPVEQIRLDRDPPGRRAGRATGSEPMATRPAEPPSASRAKATAASSPSSPPAPATSRAPRMRLAKPSPPRCACGRPTACPTIPTPGCSPSPAAARPTRSAAARPATPGRSI